MGMNVEASAPSKGPTNTKREGAVAYYPLFDASSLRERLEKGGYQRSIVDRTINETFALDSALFAWRQKLRARGHVSPTWEHQRVMALWIGDMRKEA